MRQPAEIAIVGELTLSALEIDAAAPSFAGSTSGDGVRGPGRSQARLEIRRAA